jgi:Dockerin type I domain
VPAIQMSGVQPLVQPNGFLIIVGEGGAGMVAIRSTDGGVTYGSPALIASLNSHSPTGMRAPALPSSAMDGAGNVYVAWADCRFRTSCSANDIVMSTSADGITWPANPTRIPIDSTASGVDHFIPGLGIDPLSANGSAGLGLSYYYFPVASCTVSACQLDVGFVSSNDGGATWSSAIQLNAQAMSLSWLADTDWPGRMVGDYISTVSANGQFLSVFALATTPTDSTFNEAMVVASVSAGSPTPTASTTPSPTGTPTPTPTLSATPTPSRSPTPTCPNGTAPPWPVPTNDPDCDGFTSSLEAFIGTDPNKGCAATAAPNDEPPPDAWPVDFNNDQVADLTDIFLIVPHLNTADTDPGSSTRFDLNGDGFINLDDIFKVIPFLNKSCAP